MRKVTLLAGLVVVAAMLNSAYAIDSVPAEQTDATANKATNSWPAQTYAPYVDVTVWPPFDISKTVKSNGIKHYVLAFITASGKEPCWGGYKQYNIENSDFHKKLKLQIAAVREAGGDVMVSFGGEGGKELSQVYGDDEMDELVAGYQKVIDAYDLTCIDFDVEGAAGAEPASIARRSKAMAILQKNAAAKGKKLSIWLTLAVLPTGLTDATKVVQSAVDNGVDLAGVNIMTMCFGSWAAPNPEHKMGEYAIQAAASTVKQLQKIYGDKKTEAELWSMIGVTPMIGRNNPPKEIFWQDDARKLLAFAEKKKIGILSIWSLTRDKASPKGKTYVSPKFSSIDQKPYEFSNILKVYPEGPKAEKKDVDASENK